MKCSFLDIDAIEARVNAATKGPWHHRAPKDHPHEWVASEVPAHNDPRYLPYPIDILSDENYDTKSADCAFIAAARDDVPTLIAEVRRLRAMLETR